MRAGNEIQFGLSLKHLYLLYTLVVTVVSSSHSSSVHFSPPTVTEEFGHGLVLIFKRDSGVPFPFLTMQAYVCTSTGINSSNSCYFTFVSHNAFSKYCGLHTSVGARMK